MTKTFSETVVPARTGPYANDYLWSTLGDWSGGSLPAASDAVSLSLSYGTTLAVDVASTVGAITYTIGGTLLVGTSFDAASVGVGLAVSGASITVAFGASMNVAGNIVLGTAGTVQVAGSLTAAGLSFTPTGSSDTSSKVSVSSGSLTLSGQLNLSGAGSMTLAKGATLNVGEFTLNGGTADLAGNATIATLQVQSRGLTIEGNATVANLGGGAFTIGQGGTLEVTRLTSAFISGGGNVFTLDGGSLALDASVALLAGSSFSFGATTTYGASSLNVADPANFKNNSFSYALSGFGAGDQLAFGAATFSGASYSGNTLTLFGKGATPTETLTNFTFAAGASHSFSFGTDTAGGTLLTLNCFLAGTRIETPTGEAAIETLAVGDEVTTLEQGVRVARRIAWIGTRRIELAGLNEDAARAAAPVRIRAHAFADNMPARDLLVTGDHGIFHAGGLIPARMLVNGASILRESECVGYCVFHLELERHAILFADGLPAESYLDTGDRANFANAELTLKTTALREQQAAAPLLTARAAVEAVWHRLAARATALAMGAPRASSTSQTTREPALCVRLEGGALVTPTRTRDSRLFFVLPAGSRGAALVSRSAIPAEIEGPFLDDRRRLGVCVRSLTLWTELCSTRLAPYDSGCAGWHDAECASEAGRWTNGAASLGLQPPMVATILEVELAATTLYSAHEAPAHRLLA
ncbi:Hint domain-containing protein [Lichenicoccus sp.]|uniref:Hint domain-containing protein n=1 Tax=Lichenicoccus sp. TaxID=2781899 RepID=UPI003D108D06